MSSTSAIPLDEAPAAPRPAPRRRPVLDRVRSFLFGHDIFVSYARADALEYAQELADLLVQHRVAAYVDQLGTPPGPKMPPLLLLRLRLSSMLVLIGSPGAAASAAVAQEVEEFSRHNHRIFVVDVAGALDGLPWYRERIKGGPARKITPAELASGVPSGAVVEQVLKNIDFARREDRLRRTMRRTLAAIAVLLLVGVGAGAFAAMQLGRVREFQRTGDALYAAQRAGTALDRSGEPAGDLALSTLLAVESLRARWTVDGAAAWLRGMSLLPPRPALARAHGGQVTALAVSPDGRWLASGAADGSARVWRLREHAGGIDFVPAAALPRRGDGGRVMSLALGPDGGTLALGDERSLEVWALAGARPVLRGSAVFHQPVRGVAFSPDGRLLGVAATYATHLLETAGLAGTPLERDGHFTALSVAFSPDGTRLALGGTGVEIWDVATRTRLAASGTDASTAWALRFGDDGTELAGGDGTWKIEPDGEGKVALEERVQTASVWDVRALALGLDALYLLDARGEVVRAAGSDQEVVARIGEADHAAAFTPDARWLLVGGDDGTVAAWPVARNETVHLPHGAQVNSLAFSPDRRWLATADARRTVRLFEAGTWREVHRIADAGETVRFSPGGRWLFAVGHDTIRAYEAGSWRPRPPLAHAGKVLELWVGPGDARLATRTDREFARGPGITRHTRRRVWDIESGAELAWREEPEEDEGYYRREPRAPSELTAGGDSALAAASAGWTSLEPTGGSPDGHWSVSAGSGPAAALRDSATGRVVAELRPHEGSVREAAFSADGRWLASAGGDGTVRLWLLGPAEAMVDAACARLTRNLTREEWKLYFPRRPYRPTCPRLPVPPPDSAAAPPAQPPPAPP